MIFNVLSVEILNEDNIFPERQSIASSILGFNVVLFE